MSEVLLAIGYLLAAVTLPGTLELFLVTLGALLPSKKPSEEVYAPGVIAVVIPAYDEEDHIVETINSLKACNDPFEETEVIVVADNCSDQTAFIAENQGVRVITRQDSDRRGKGYALNDAFEILLQENYEFFVVIDADTIVEPNLIVEVRKGFAHKNDALQAVYTVFNNNGSYRTRVMRLALSAFNVVRPKGRQRWRLSVGLMGNGFALRRSTLEKVPYRVYSIVEDLEYHLLLVKAQLRVGFLENTSVKSVVPSKSNAAAIQRVRWEGGRLRIMRELTMNLFKGILSGNFRLIEPLMELLLFPLSLHVLLLSMGLFTSSTALKVYFMIAWSVVGMHLSVAIALMKEKTSRIIFTILMLPFYVFWRMILLPRIFSFSKKEAPWQRTARER